jgi:hypothetical protein
MRPTCWHVIPSAVQFVHMFSGPPHASSASPAKHPLGVQQPPHDRTSQSAQQTLPMTFGSPLGLHTSIGEVHVWHA